jgi:hypothetical protein
LDLFCFLFFWVSPNTRIGAGYTMERKKAGKKRAAIAGAPVLFFCVFLVLMHDCFTVVLFGLLIFASIRSLGSALVG